MNLYISTLGNDRWSGRLDAPNADGADGPLATVTGARDAIRRLRGPGMQECDTARQAAALDGPVTVWMAGGVYRIAEPLRFGPEDSAPVTYRAMEGQTVVVDGGLPLTGWERATIHGLDVWSLDLNRAGLWPLPDRRQLFVNGRRARRSRLPKIGFYHIEDGLVGPEGVGWGKPGSDRFVARADEFRAWTNLEDTEVVAFHYWIDERMPVTGFDPATRTVTSRALSRAPLTFAWARGDMPYIVENALEGLTEPGEWAFDGAARRLWYVPRPGETPETAEAVMPLAAQLLQVVGESDAPVSWLRFEGVTFRHAASVIAGEPGERTGVLGMPRETRFDAAGRWLASSGQAAVDQAGALYFRNAAGCALENCVVEHVGGYAVQLDEGCREIRLCGNTLRDLGGGGITASGVDAAGPRSARVRLLRIADNHIHQGGEIVHAAVGILARHVGDAAILHNHIHDLYYTAISVGWVWGYRDSVSQNNHIAFNHLHDIGKGVLSDMGGIYTLGPQPGTVIRNNLIHDISSAVYGGWAIYPDEGSSHLVIEDNVAYRTDCSVFHQHYGRENIVRNNIFAFGGEGIVAITRREPHRSATFLRNIFLSDRGYVYGGGYAYMSGEPGALITDLNAVWDTRRGMPVAVATRTSMEAAVDPDRGGVSWADWMAAGFDRHSVVADPLFENPEAGDFRLKPESPALTLGFRPIDLARVGPRPVGERESFNGR